MEVVIRRQDELICKINDENMVLKFKLFSMEFLMHEEVIYNTHSDGNNGPQGSLHAESHDCEQLINVKLPTLNTVDLTITDKPLLRDNNSRDSLADNSILDRPNGNSSLPRKIYATREWCLVG